VGSTYLIGLPDVRACTPETEADPWIAGVGDRFCPVDRIEPPGSISTLATRITTVNHKSTTRGRSARTTRLVDAQVRDTTH